MRVLYTTSDSAASRAIRRIDGGEASHCGIVIGDQVWGSTFKHDGVRPWALEEWVSMDGRRPVADHTFPVPDERASLEAAVAMLGWGYDLGGVLGIAIWRSKHSHGRVWCSEYLALCLVAGGIKLPDEGRRFGVRHAMLATSMLAQGTRLPTSFA